MSLLSAWIDCLFERLHVRYGSAWLERWRGLEPTAVKADWALVLSGIPGDAIAHGLEHLPPDWPPTATEFRSLCLRVPRAAAMPKLDAPSADPVRVQAILDRMRKLGERRAPGQWVVDMAEREKSGEAFTLAQRTMWMAALRRIDEPISHAGAVIPDSVLPPAMRQHFDPENQPFWPEPDA